MDLRKSTVYSSLPSSLGLYHRYYIAISGSVVIIIWMHVAIVTGCHDLVKWLSYYLYFFSFLFSFFLSWTYYIEGSAEKCHVTSVT